MLATTRALVSASAFVFLALLSRAGSQTAPIVGNWDGTFAQLFDDDVNGVVTESTGTQSGNATFNPDHSSIWLGLVTGPWSKHDKHYAADYSDSLKDKLELSFPNGTVTKSKYHVKKIAVSGDSLLGDQNANIEWTDAGVTSHEKQVGWFALLRLEEP